ncbi:hypothetical protein [Falsigemmobacter faecalis]|uniref:Lipoprotein n=1 Tax=Falsigemmobacter faecalis TaxID=2488730 RepID=A0A3P3DIN2_9RHOB|nr:hypothetical protein [Falsigemmobacter faecalis]RRH73566.1 hypothetical protein EG244_12875 [Falsigemmobacter faecalis]
MVQQNRILTVSYGTFSCTLEGFNDPFGTMKAIAEYFRDLASEDRYFGAEPPQPDAAMLHRIAEREIQRRVEARVTENSVVLRAEEDPSEAEHVQPRITMHTAEDAQPELPAQRPALRAVDAPEAGGESVAERLMRLRAASQARDADAEVAEEAAYEAGAAEEISAGPIEAEMPDLTDLTLDLAPESDLGEDLVAAGSRTAASLLAEAEALQTEAPSDTVAADPAEAAKEEAAADSPNGWEVRRRSRQMERRRARRAAREAENAAAAADSGFSFDALESSLAGFEAEARDDLARDTVAPVPPAAAAEASPDVQSLIARMTAQAAAETPVQPGPPRRVIRILREDAPVATSDSAETDSMIASLLGALEETKEAPAASLPRLHLPEAPGVAEAVAEVAPVAEIAAEAAAEAETALPARPRRPERSGAATARPAPLRPLRERPDAPPAAAVAQVSVERLIRQVGSEMEEPATRRRTSTIAHLKAAVAATVAERMIPGLRREPKDETVVYRNDLADAVSAEEAGRPAAGGRVAPLVLVSSQRVERAPAAVAAPAPAPAAPMRPRRVSSAVLAEAVAPAPLAARAPGLSIDAATELLETAAQSILASAEEPVFTRPQLMREAELEARGFSRDEALIAFGTLLREGRILRASRGLFTLAEDGAAA